MLWNKACHLPELQHANMCGVVDRVVGFLLVLVWAERNKVAHSQLQAEWRHRQRLAVRHRRCGDKTCDQRVVQHWGYLSHLVNQCLRIVLGPVRWRNTDKDNHVQAWLNNRPRRDLHNFVLRPRLPRCKARNLKKLQHG